MGPLPLPGLSEVREEEEPAPPLLANQEQRSVFLPRLLEDGLQTPAARQESMLGDVVRTAVGGLGWKVHVKCSICSSYLLVVGDL